jgi:predicted ATPase
MAPNHFTRVALRNFKGHVSTNVPLSQFTLLVGANGTGKTSVLDAIRVVRDALHLVGSATPAMGWRKLVQHKNEAEFIESLEVECVQRSIPEGFLSTKGSLDLSIKLDFSGGTAPIEFRLPFGPNQRPSFVGLTGTAAAQVRDEVSAELAKGALLLQLDTRAIVTPSQSQSEIPVIGADGSGLATALKELKANDEARFDEFRRAVRAVIPLVEDFRFARRKRTASRSRSIRVEDQVIDVPESYDVIEDELLIRFAGTGFIRARAASEGTLITIALLGLLYANAQPPRLILIDDLDRGLHIEAQGELVRALRKVLEHHPDTQIIATGHSPYLADHFAPNDVVILRRPSVGAPIEATRLSEHPDKVLREFKTGEALVATGKDWFG